MSQRLTYSPLIVESIAYMCRTISYSSPRPFIPYIISSVLTLVTRAFFAATTYTILGRIMHLLHAEHHSLIPVNRLNKLFVCLEIMSFQVQSAGAGIQAAKDDILRRAGEIVIVAVLVLQIIISCLFLGVTLVFHRRTLKQPTHVSLGSLQWELHLGGLYGASILLLVRDIIRAVEYIQGCGGYIHKHGYFLYVFDAAPMFGVMLVMAVIYAPRLLQQRQEGELEEATEPPSYERTIRVKA